MSEISRLPFPDDKPYNIVPLGVASGGEEVAVDLESYPHMLIVGMSGSGKTVTQRTILMHCLQSPNWWVVLIDPKRVESSAYKDAENVVEVATELETMVESIAKVETMMHTRYMEMREAGVNRFRSLPDPPPAIMLMVDEVFPLLAIEGGDSDESKTRDALRAQAATLLGSISRLGRAAGVHLVLATQRPDGRVIPGELRNNLDCRIAQGRMAGSASMMVLDGDQATRLPDVKGRAMVRLGSEYTEFQAYFVPPEEVERTVAMCNILSSQGTVEA